MVKKTTPETTERLARFSDYALKVDFHQECARKAFKDLIGKEITVLDALVLKDFRSKVGVHDCMIIYFDLSGNKFTTITSGEVVIDKITRAQKDNLLPLLGKVVHDERYYDIL